MNWSLYNQSLTVKGDTRRDRAIFETQRSKEFQGLPGIRMFLSMENSRMLLLLLLLKSITKK